MKLRILLIGLLMACFTVSVTPYWVNSYSGETVGDAVLAGMAGCAAQEVWKGATSPQPAPTQPRTVPSREEMERSYTSDCQKRCFIRFDHHSEDDKLFACLEACK